MAAEEGIQEAETEETQSPAAFKRQGGQDRFGRERRLSNSTWGDPAEKTRTCQSNEDSRSLESRLAAIRQTHDAVLKGIEAAQDNMVKTMQGDPRVYSYLSVVLQAPASAKEHARMQIPAECREKRAYVVGVVPFDAEQEKQYIRAFQQRTQDILEQTKKLQKKQKPPLELETLHQMLTMNLKAAEEEAKHFAALSKKLTEKNKELATENSILREQNEILMKQKAMQQRQEKREKEFIAMAKQGNIKASLETPEVSPRLLGPPLTPRTVAKVKAKIRQYTKGNNYERELKMRAEISRLHELCKRQKTELIILKGTDGRRVELELLLKQCLHDVKARIAGKRGSTVVSNYGDATTGRGSLADGLGLSIAERDEILKRFFKMKQVIKLLHQIVSTTGTASEFDFSWLDREEDETEVDCGASVSPPPTCVKTTTSHASNRKPK